MRWTPQFDSAVMVRELLGGQGHYEAERRLCHCFFFQWKNRHKLENGSLLFFQTASEPLDVYIEIVLCRKSLGIISLLYLFCACKADELFFNVFVCVES